MHIVGIAKLVIEMDTQYVCGMLNNPDVQPNTAINHWIAAILLVNFKLVHIPTEKHLGPNSLSRLEPILGEYDDEGNPEEWVDKILSLSIWLNTWNEFCPAHPSSTMQIFQATEGGRGGLSTPRKELTFPPPSDKAHGWDSELPEDLIFLTEGKLPN